jgi:hypothetical protein
MEASVPNQDLDRNVELAGEELTPSERREEIDDAEKHTLLDSDDDDDDDDYPHLFQSMRSSTGLEIGVRVTWPDAGPAMQLSTCLPADEIAPMFHGTQWAGTRVWKAAIVALQYLLEDQSPLQELLSKTKTTDDSSSSLSVLELGCGLGVPGMVLQRLFPTSRVVVTDCPALLPQLRANLSQNFATTSPIQAASLDWAAADDLDRLLAACQLESFALVLNCDCIYEPLYGDSWKALLQVQTTLLQRKPDCLMLTSLERRKFDGADAYFAALDAHPNVESVELVHEDHPVEIYRLWGRLAEQE